MRRCWQWELLFGPNRRNHSSRPYTERSGSGCNVDGCAAPSDDSTTGSNTYFNSGGTTAKHAYHFDSDTAAVELGHPVRHITDRQPVHFTGGTFANELSRSSEPSELCIDFYSNPRVDAIYLFGVPIFVGWIDECSGRGGGITDHIDRLHGSCY
ncbi:hypothetical protein UCDDA912_g08953 [Diaporthe ampelina]|uniref:Uncharacterized protein n=1 Tax=Diaporthe ampelina TaxID=1214573 RepID=A0A0G2HSJ1_9PEZI|nr:hypothetical protein UCDDA912_g08953 [Diaporthe ampelina]